MAAAKWCVINRVLMNQLAGREGWRVVRYEQLWQAPETIVGCLCEDLELAADAPIAWLPDDSRRQHEADPGSTAKNRRAMAFGWREHLTPAHIEQVLWVVEAFDLTDIVENDSEM